MEAVKWKTMLFLSIELTEISLPLLKPNTFKLAKSEPFLPHTSHKQDKDALHMELSHKETYKVVQ